ncbi:MAG: hypothetical protein C5B60_05560 [Chloroflexi bacterium]|nr:MAG: hypothetical protein C5B60_05560 [Chloroflexota bacterium]
MIDRRIVLKLGPRARRIIWDSSIPQEAKRGLEPQGMIIRALRASEMLLLPKEAAFSLLEYFEGYLAAISGPGVDNDSDTQNERRALRRIIGAMTKKLGQEIPQPPQLRVVKTDTKGG